MNRPLIKSTLLKALEAAGAILKRSLGQREASTKDSALSLVTATDKAAEKMILETIKAEFPDHAFLTEESPAEGRSSSRWIIDPVDGTTNFAHTFPMACVSIAFEQDGILEFGGVFDPFRDELFIAEKGQGAFLNGEPIHVSANATLSQSLLCTGFPYDRRERADFYLSIIKAFIMEVHGVRRTGTAALDLCYVACGRFDGFWEVKLNAWDKAAAMVILEEAGGRLSDFSGNPLTLDGIQNLASNGLVHDEMLEVLKPYKEM
ncbi:MAG: inositol monophosphatase family protein [Candidatus Omnitrophota bacterium]|nr:inositol monophosphatase family protein [Candidatus Omnitrophota bacterium]